MNRQNYFTGKPAEDQTESAAEWQKTVPERQRTDSEWQKTVSERQRTDSARQETAPERQETAPERQSGAALKGPSRFRGKIYRGLAALMAAALLLLSLCSCAQCRHYDPADYMLELPYKENFRILQLNDIHLSASDNRQLQYDFLDLTISEADADLILMDGDVFTFADKTTVKEFFSFIDGYGVPWTLTFGNHDEQCLFPISWLTGLLNAYGSNCVFLDLQDDDLTGNCNFVINLAEEGTVKEQLILMDSNRYNYAEYKGYDYIKEEQIQWYADIVSCTEETYGEDVRSLLFFHIPLPEFADAWDAAAAGDPSAVLEYGEKNEDVCCPEVNSGLFDRVLELGKTDGIFCGHDHINNFRVRWQNVLLCYGVKSTDRVYRYADMMGGMVITVRSDSSIDIDYIYHDYSEVTR